MKGINGVFATQANWRHRGNAEGGDKKQQEGADGEFHDCRMVAGGISDTRAGGRSGKLKEVTVGSATSWRSDG